MHYYTSAYMNFTKELLYNKILITIVLSNIFTEFKTKICNRSFYRTKILHHHQYYILESSYRLNFFSLPSVNNKASL